MSFSKSRQYTPSLRSRDEIRTETRHNTQTHVVINGYKIKCYLNFYELRKQRFLLTKKRIAKGTISSSRIVSDVELALRGHPACGRENLKVPLRSKKT